MSATITGDSPAAVAYRLMLDILRLEGKASSMGAVLVSGESDLKGAPITRRELLDLYRECLQTTQRSTHQP